MLFARHVDAARRLARQLVRGSDADDLVSEAFTKVMGVLQRGGGPDIAFRAYLLTAVRRLHVDRIRGQSRLTTSDDMTASTPACRSRTPRSSSSRAEPRPRPSPRCPSAGSWCCGTSRWRARSPPRSPPCSG